MKEKSEASSTQVLLTFYNTFNYVVDVPFGLSRFKESGAASHYNAWTLKL